MLQLKWLFKGMFSSIPNIKNSLLQKSTSTDLLLPQGLQVYVSRKFDYCQLLMLVIVEFNTAISKLPLLRQW